MSVRTLRARLAAETRHHPDTDHSDLKRELKAAGLEAYIRRVVDIGPPLTPEQRDRLATLLRGGDAA